MFASMPYGLCRLTPKLNTHGVCAGYQMTCTDPRHDSKTLKCTKTLSHSKSGSEEDTLRQLKLWILLGASTASKMQHQKCGRRWLAEWEMVKCPANRGFRFISYLLPT